MPLYILVFVVIIAPELYVLWRFVMFIARGKVPGLNPLGQILDFVMLVVYPAIAFAAAFEGDEIDCCTKEGAATFAPDHLLSIIVLYVLALMALFYSRRRKQFGPPGIETLVSLGLVIGMFLTAFILYQYLGGGENDQVFGLVGCIPVILLFMLELVVSHQAAWPDQPASEYDNLIDVELIIGSEQGKEVLTNDPNYKLLLSPIFVKVPILFLLALPVVTFIQACLLLFGQRLDSPILAFTQTYYKGFSQLGDYCANIPCEGGHYLCSVAAGGHPWVVRPLRKGIRHGREIICNRQLLVANAFEELVQEQLPAAHRIIRRNYDRLGDFIHKDYIPYQNPWLCDLIYLLMKPADWAFRIVLYLCCRDPEGRIARQYDCTS